MKRPGSESLSRRAVLATGAKLSLLGAFCATIGSTVIAACMDDGYSPGGNGSGSGSGSGYGYGYGYGYDDQPGGGYGYGGYGGYGY